MGVYGSYVGIYEKTGLHGSYVTLYKNIQDYMGYTGLYGNKREYTGLITLITQITLITGIKLNNHSNLDAHQYNSPITLLPDNLYGTLTVSLEHDSLCGNQP